jgi:hypothetical protein
MKKALLFLGLGIALTSCGNAFCDCDLYEDDYTWDGFAYQLDASNLVAEDTCLDAGILDSATVIARQQRNIIKKLKGGRI